MPDATDGSRKGGEGRDEQSWTAQYLALGGSRIDGEILERRMRQSSRAPAPLKPVLSAVPAFNAARSALQTSVGSATERCLVPNAIAQTASACADSTRTDTDLFGEARPAMEQGRSISRVRPSRIRRGRKPSALGAKPPTQRELELFQLSLEIDERNGQKPGDLGFLATAMIYASLPHSKFPGAIFKRRNGPISLTIMNDPDIGIPYGKIPRIITAFLCTEAKRTRDPNIDLGRSQTEFMRKLGLHNRGGQRGDIRRLRDQSKRLFMSTISLIGEPGNRFEWRKVNITDQGMLLWNPHDPTEQARWQSTLTLSTPFFQECIKHGVPIKMWVLHKLRSPLAIDIYVWLTYRFNDLREPQPVSWKQLQWQFGSAYALTPQGESNFKYNFRKALRQVLALYRQAKVDVRQDIVMLLPSKPHVPPLIER